MPRHRRSTSDVYNRGAAALRFGPARGSSARALKRFVNLYRLARVQNQPHKGALAFLLALDAGARDPKSPR